MIQINGVDLPAPVEYSVSLQDIDSENTRRTETGVLQRDRVRAGVYKIQVKWRVTKTQLKTITDALKPAKFSVMFFDPTTSTNPTRSMYCGDRNADLLYNEVNPDESLWELSTSLIEY
jgi:hypothetical protein